MEEEKEAAAAMVTPGEVLGRVWEVKPGKGAYAAPHNDTVYASLTGYRRNISPASDSSDQRPIVEVTGHKAHGPVPQPGSIVIARVTKVMAKSASAHIVCVGTKSVREIFTGIISGEMYVNVEFGSPPAPPAAGEDPDPEVASPLKPPFYYLLSRWLCLAGSDGQSGGIGLGGLLVHDIKQQDVRATEIDKVDMHLSFRPGDIVRALVVSLGDARAYFLSTAKNELGVVSAESTAGATMVPVSWTEMQCPLTGQIEQRKVAKMAS